MRKDEITYSAVAETLDMPWRDPFGVWARAEDGAAGLTCRLPKPPRRDKLWRMGWFDWIREPRQDDTALPRFRYHPDPLATGAITPSDAVCVCCGRARGFVYNGEPYSRQRDLENRVCPWCIADGSAARTFKATFVSATEIDLPADRRRELFERTPGYESWQGENWLCHHNDACEFHGDATREDLNALTEAEETLFLRENDFMEDDWADMKASHDPKASSYGVYKFRCRHCGLTRLGVDMS